jgi:phage terminase Nu1 subunit (DNA packaging protein)
MMLDAEALALIGLDPTDSPDDTDLVTGVELARFLGITDSHVATLGRNEVLPRTGEGRSIRYPLKKSVRAYCDFLRQKATGRLTADMEKAKLAVWEANAEKVRLQNEKAAGRLLDAQEVRAQWLSLAADLRSRLLAVPGRVAARMSLDRPTAAALDREIRAAMSELAEGEAK